MGSRTIRRAAARLTIATIVAAVASMPVLLVQTASASTYVSAASSAAHGTPMNNGGAHGKHGKFSFPDSAKPGTGVRCTYSRGQLSSVTLASPLAAGRGYWLRGQYIPWKGKLERKQGSSWKLVALGRGDDSKPIKSKVLTARPPLTIPVKHGAPGSGVYRVVEKLLWIANLPGGPEEGYAKHIVRHYHVGFGDRDRRFCVDATPTVSPPGALSVVGGNTLNLDSPGLLAHARQAQHDPLHAAVVSVTADGQPWQGATVSRNGRLQVKTAAADIGKAIVLRYRAIDAAGRTSTPVAVTINVTDAGDGSPVAVDQTFGPGTSGQVLSVPAPGLLNGASGSGLSVDSVTNESFDPTTDVFSWDPDGSFAVAPSAADAAVGRITFDYDVVDSAQHTSAPATTTIDVAPLAADHNFGPATPGQQFAVTAPGLLKDAAGPGLTVDAISNENFDPSADAFAVNTSTGSFTITPQLSEDSTDLTFHYTVLNSDNVESAPATVTVAVGHLAPVGNADSFTVADGQTLNACVLDNDTFYGNAQPHTAAEVSGSQSFTNSFWHFSFNGSNGCFTLTAPSNATPRTLTFSYRPVDTSTGSQATVSISVTR